MDVFRTKTAILAVAGRIKAHCARLDGADGERRHGQPTAAAGAKQTNRLPLPASNRLMQPRNPFARPSLLGSQNEGTHLSRVSRLAPKARLAPLDALDGESQGDMLDADARSRIAARQTLPLRPSRACHAPRPFRPLRVHADRQAARVDQPRQPDPREPRPGDGEPFGVSIDLARAFAERLSAELELVVFDTAGKSVQALTDERADFGFFAVDPLRGETVAFTAPYVLIEGSIWCATRRRSARTQTSTSPTTA